MAEKEATVYIVDIGKSMGERHNGRAISDLEWAMQYVWDRITTTVCNHLLRLNMVLKMNMNRSLRAARLLLSAWLPYDLMVRLLFVTEKAGSNCLSRYIE